MYIYRERYVYVCNICDVYTYTYGTHIYTLYKYLYNPSTNISVLRTEPKALPMLGKRSTIELHYQI